MITIRKLQEINTQRAKRWHGSEGLEQWTVMEWAAAMCGEAGEAANVAKKLRREDLGLNRKDYGGRDNLRFKLAEECADVAIYLVLLCEREGLDLEAAIVQKFNQTSEQYGFPERLEETPEEVK